MNSSCCSVQIDNGQRNEIPAKPEPSTRRLQKLILFNHSKPPISHGRRKKCRFIFVERNLLYILSIIFFKTFNLPQKVLENKIVFSNIYFVQGVLSIHVLLFTQNNIYYKYIVCEKSIKAIFVKIISS